MGNDRSVAISPPNEPNTITSTLLRGTIGGLSFSLFPSLPDGLSVPSDSLLLIFLSQVIDVAKSG